MKRRNFLQMMAATGLLATPFAASRVHAASVPQFIVAVNASGGWDPTSLCDPKGLNGLYSENSDRYEGSTNSVALDDSKRFNQIQWSAIPEGVSNDVEVRARIESQFDTFFTQYGNQLTVINGIDTETNNHDTGSRVVWSGNEETGYPNIAALYAAAVAPTLPLAFISNGGYDFTDSLVARARASNADFIAQLADPNLYYDQRGFIYRSADASVDLYDPVIAARNARLQRQLDNAELLQRRQQLQALANIRGADNNLALMVPTLESIQANVSRDLNWNSNRANDLKSQAEVVAAAFASNLCAGATLNYGGFDTHGNHDASAYPRLGDLLEGVHFLVQALTYAGVADRTTIVIGSDFGRTPYYNSGNGKDHWPVTSMMVLHPQATGGRVFGASGPGFEAQSINTETGLIDSANGQRLTPAHVNASLRALLGIDNSAVVQSYSLGSNPFRIFA